MPEGLRRPILPGGRARGGIGNCRWVRRATPIPTEPAMGREFNPHIGGRVYFKNLFLTRLVGDPKVFMT